MKLHLSTSVWGAWHLDVFRRVTLPTLLSPNNLAALVSRLDVRYRIATTPAERDQITAWPIYRHLANTVPVEWITERDDLPLSFHVEWIHASIADARSDGARWGLVPPDVAWSDGTFAHVADVMLRGKAGTAVPYVRVISETCIPDIDARGAGAPITLPPGELVRLGLRHMHPLSAAGMYGGPHGRPSLEILWRVADEGLLLRHMTRELFVFDPTRIKATEIWYAAEGCTIDDCHVVTDSDDMLILSVTPLFKDLFMYIPEHRVTSMELARQSLHPLNENPLTSEFARYPVRLHYGKRTPSRWHRAEVRSDVFVSRAIMMREFLRIWRTLDERGCRRAAELMSVALQTTPLARRWRHDGPVTAFIPSDAAIERHGWQQLEGLMAPDASRRLIDAILSHAIPGRVDEPVAGATTLQTLGSRSVRIEPDADGLHINGARVIEQYDVAPHRVLVVDGWLAS